jgi:hypothetical protein
MLQPALTPADGAQFFGTIDCVDRGRGFRAACFAQVKNRMTEQPHIRMFGSDDDAVKWVDQEARRRGFDKYALTRRCEDTPKSTMARGLIADPETGRNVAIIRNGEIFRDDAGQAKIARVRDGVLYDLECSSWHLI